MFPEVGGIEIFTMCTLSKSKMLDDEKSKYLSLITELGHLLRNLAIF